MRNLLIAARDEGVDVFNALKLMDNESFFAPLRFGAGDGTLHYYLYNWKCAKLAPGQVGIVLL
jgi:glycylpeptide N-tetradecanoyltransferase